MSGMFESEQTGKIPDLADIVANIESEACPFTSMIPKLPKTLQAKQTWQVEQYPEDGHAGVMDGEDVTTFTKTPRAELSGRSQKIWNNPSVSDFAGEAQIAGLSKGEMANQIAKSIVRAKRIIEKRALSANDCTEDNGTNVPNATRGIFSWLSKTAQAVYPVPAAYLPPAACNLTTLTLATFTEAAFKTAAAAAYKLRKGPSTLDGFVGIDLKGVFSNWANYEATVSNFTAVRQFQQSADSKTLQMSVDTLEMDTGTVRLHPSSYLYTLEATGAAQAQTHRSGVFVMMEMLGMGYTRWPSVRKLENKGGGERAIVDAIFSFICRNPQGHISVEISADA